MINVSFCRLGRIIPAPFAGYVLPYVRKSITQQGESDDYTIIGAMWNGLACGVAVVRWDAEDGEILSFFVDPKARGCGVAGHMLDLILAEGWRMEKDCLFVDYTLKEKELAAMDALIRRRGGEYENGAPVCGMSSADFLEHSFLGPALHPGWKRPEPIVLFSELTQSARACLDSGNTLPDYLKPSALGERLDPALSAAWLENGTPVAFTLGFQSGERMFCQSSIWRSPEAPEGSFRALICTQVNQCWYRSGGDFVFFISPINPRSAAMAEWFTGGNYEPYTQREAMIPIREDA